MSPIIVTSRRRTLESYRTGVAKSPCAPKELRRGCGRANVGIARARRSRGVPKGIRVGARIGWAHRNLEIRRLSPIASKYNKYGYARYRHMGRWLVGRRSLSILDEIPWLGHTREAAIWRASSERLRATICGGLSARGGGGIGAAPNFVLVGVGREIVEPTY